MKKISIIVPIYNTEKYLEKCIQSILNQKYKNFELILINDGSTDNSLEICKKYAINNKKIKIIDKHNEGIAKTRNIGINLAEGDYISFVDSDDYIEEDIYIRAIKEMEMFDLDVVEFGLCNIYKDKIDNISLKNTDVISGEKALETLIEGKAFNVMWNKLYKRELFDNISFPVGKIYEDGYVMWKIYLKVARYKSIDDILYNRIIRENSIMSNQKKYSLKNLDGLESQEERYFYLKKYIDNKNMLDLALKRLFEEYIFHYKMLSLNKNLDLNYEIRKKIIFKLQSEYYSILKNKKIGLSKIIIIFSYINKKLFSKIICKI